MLRTQIQLTEEQHRQLRIAARRQGVSLAEMVRRCVAKYIDDEQPDRKALYRRAAMLVGSLDDPDRAADLSEGHDEYLDEAYP